MKKIAIAAITAVVVAASFASIAEARRSAVIKVCNTTTKAIYPSHAGIRVVKVTKCSLRRYL